MGIMVTIMARRIMNIQMRVMAVNGDWRNVPKKADIAKPPYFFSYGCICCARGSQGSIVSGIEGNAGNDD